MTNNLFSFLLLVTVMCFASCQEEPCDTVTCLNDGICMDGTCECLPGFEGSMCDVFSREKITGNFDVVSDCMGTMPEATDTWSIAASADASNEVFINNFHFPALNVIATITDPTTLDIKEQFIAGPTSYTISGSGTIDGEGQLSVEYTISNDLSSDIIECSASATRQ